MATDSLTWQELRDVKRSEFDEAARAWREVSSRSAADRDTVRRGMNKLIETQESEASRSAVKRLDRLIRNYEYVYRECGLIWSALSGLSADLAEPQRRLNEALEEAASLSLTVNPDGSVSYPSAIVGSDGGGSCVSGGTARAGFPNPLTPPVAGDGKPPRIVPDVPDGDRFRVDFHLNPKATQAQDIADRIAGAVRAAAGVDHRYAQTFARLKAAKGLDVTEAMMKDVLHDTADVGAAAAGRLVAAIPDGASPAEVRTWWEGLSEEQRREFMEVAPDAIGMLDGIPAATRDEANRAHLPVLIAQLERQGGEQDMLAGLRKIEGKLRDYNPIPMYLLGIGAEGNGRAIISYGNPDTSRNVSAYVPGLKTKLDEGFAGGTVNRALDTAMGAREFDKSTASIVWLGYDAPQNIDVMSTADADRGAPAYNDFMAGLAATSQHDDPHVTAIGHSYGSLTVGTAAKQSGGIPGVDDIILVGSPGVGVDKAADLGVPPERVYVGSADNDIVTKLPSKGEVAGMGPGPAVGAALVGYDGDDIYFGKDPASKAFGAQRFLVGDGPHPFTPGEHLTAHSQYFNPDTDNRSAENIARIVSGRYGITKEEHR
ncbi:alpha/beta hydrolase [Streptomyces sp. NPDC048057]|uniref:alpha/beta hydrolase n=1 Tax=Streptomyces sp. NPDC048057 TaxID=3155628 RepID=UPI00340810D7